jgi:hypothetical protein
MHSIDVNTDSLYVHHHLGLGDHIICNGLVRYLLKTIKPTTLWLVVKNKNLNNVKRLYRDLPSVKYVPVEEDGNFYDMPFQWNKMKLVRVGFERCRDTDFDVSFYDSVGIPFVERWNSWYFQRDTNTESSLIEELNLPEKFALVHDTSSIGRFDLSLSCNLPIVRVSKAKNETSIFDWMGIIERATEIHCIDSSFIHLVNSVSTVGSLFYHKIKPSRMEIAFRDKWSVINY